MSIEVQQVSKYFGTQRAVDSISFSASKGEVIGFLGPNGAGKSTTMKMITGFLKPNEGTVFVKGIDVVKQPLSAQKHLGYLPEQNPLYQEMYVREYLRFQASVFRIPYTKVEEVINTVGLLQESHKKIKELSKGYQQRVGIAAAIIHNPEVLILDEPTTGLDPNQLQEIRGLIKELGKEKTILFSTHIMQEVEAVCDRVIIIHKGKLLLDKPIRDLKESNEQQIEVMFDYKLEEQFIKRLPNLTQFKNLYNNSWLLTFETEQDMRSSVFDFAYENGLKILQLSAKNKSLENLFQEITKD